jgi:site-specific recombinase XerD
MKLSQAVDLYIQRKQGAGMRFVSPRNRLRSFLRHCGDTDLRRITTQQVTAFLDGSGSMPSGWNGKRGTLRTFFDYWTARGRLKSSPLPSPVPKVTQSFIPYIYSRSDLRSLLDAVPRCQRRSACLMSEDTFRTLLLFLYATGMRLGEALRLRLTDVDLTLGIITIRDTKFYKSRLVPPGPDIEKLIRQYLQQPGRQNQPYRPLFQTKNGNPIPAQVAGTSFSRLRRIAGIERRDDSYFQPRLHDLRHTFAVHRLTE